MNRLKDKTKSEIALTLCLTSMIALMIFFALCRLCGWGYFANNYIEHEFSLFWSEFILFILKAFEAIIILLTLTKCKWWICGIIGIVWTFIYLLPIPTWSNTIIDIVYIVCMPLFFNKKKQESIGNSILFVAFLSIYQILLMIGRYSIDINAKFNYLAGIANIIDYKLFILVLYLFVNQKRRTMSKIKELPDIEKSDKLDWCFLFWGHRTIGQKTFDIFASIITFGIYPCIMFWRYWNICDKMKAKIKELENTSKI